MAWKLLKKVMNVAIASAVADATYNYLHPKQEPMEPPEIVAEKLKGWDSNWDNRDPSSLARPVNGENWDENELEKHQPKASRHIILVPHGQFKKGDSDVQRVLTNAGREQAKLTGQRLADFGFPITNVVASTITCAQETGKIITEQLYHPNLEEVSYREDPYIDWDIVNAELNVGTILAKESLLNP